MYSTSQRNSRSLSCTACFSFTLNFPLPLPHTRCPALATFSLHFLYATTQDIKFNLHVCECVQVCACACRSASVTASVWWNGRGWGGVAFSGNGDLLCCLRNYLKCWINAHVCAAWRVSVRTCVKVCVSVSMCLCVLCLRITKYTQLMPIIIEELQNNEMSEKSLF